jgi:hypothetical protein
LRLEPLEARQVLSVVPPAAIEPAIDAVEPPLVVDWAGSVVHDDTGDLFAIDLDDGGPIQFLGTMGAVMFDMAFSPTGVLYGVGGLPTGPSELYRIEIDFDNPGGSLDTTWIGMVSPDGFAGTFLNSLEFAPDGTLYGVGYDWAGWEYVFSIDPSDASAEYVLPLGSYYAAGDLTFDSDGQGYTVTDTGVLLEIESDMSDFHEVDFTGIYDFYGMTYGPSPTMYGFRQGGDVFRINPADAGLGYVGTFSDPRFGLVLGAATIYHPPVDLGEVDFLELVDESPILGELWYRVEPAHDGIFTADLPPGSSGRNGDLTLYRQDSQGELHVLASGRNRLDFESAVQGEQYFLQVASDKSQVDLRLTNLVQTTADSIVVHGTSGPDTVEYAPGDEHQVTIHDVDYGFRFTGVPLVHMSFTGEGGRDALQLTGTHFDETATLDAAARTVTVAGFRYDVAASGVEDASFFGKGGTDTVTLVATDADDDVAIRWQATLVTGPDYVLDVSDVDLIDVDARGGQDESTFAGSLWDDTVTLYPDSGLYLAGTYEVTTAGIETNTVTGGGGTDIAYLRDSAGDETFQSEPDKATLVGPGFSQTILGIRTVHAYGLEGGHDVARLYDSGGNDKLKAEPTFTLLRGGGYFSRAKAFEEVHGYSLAGGSDLAVFVGSPGDEDFLATADYARMTGAAFFCRAKQFEQVLARAGEGGFDVAHLVDSPGNDTLVGKSHKTQLYGANFDVTVRKFDEVHAEATAGGSDIAKLFDTTGDDLFEAAGDVARLSNNDAGLDLLYEVIAFERVRATRTTGVDVAAVTAPTTFVLELVGGW